MEKLHESSGNLYQLLVGKLIIAFKTSAVMYVEEPMVMAAAAAVDTN